MIAWMAYAALVGALIAAGAFAAERLVASAGRPRRLVWLAALALAVAVPLAGRTPRPDAPPVEEAISAVSSQVNGASQAAGSRSTVPVFSVPGGVELSRIAALGLGASSLTALLVLGGVLLVVAWRRRRWVRGRVAGAPVRVSRNFGPALVGLVVPEVVVPAWVLTLEPGARDTIIRHEEEHARARDYLTLLCGGLVVAAFPWSPAIWWMCRRLRASVEIDCDERVLASGIGVVEYGDVLLDAGRRSRGRWTFSPAMGQPQSLLERRLKTMSEAGKKLSRGHAALLVAVAVGALVVACDTPVPTELREAMEEVMADEGADTETDRTEQFLGWKDFVVGPDDSAPMIIVDGVRIRVLEDVPESLRSRFTDGLEPDVIERIEVLKGAAARELYGDDAAAGVIQIFTHDEEPEPEEIAVSEQAIGGANQPRGQIVVGGVGRGKRKAKIVIRPSVEALVVTGQSSETKVPSGWDKWHSTRFFANAPPDAKPIVYVDGVRIDVGGSGLHDLHPALDPDRIDRIEVLGGPAAEKRYGKEAANGVIQIYMKKIVPEAPRP